MAYTHTLMMNVWLLKVASYGGTLSFQLQYTLLSDDAHSYFDADVELIVSISNLFLVHIAVIRDSDHVCMMLTLLAVIKRMLVVATLIISVNLHFLSVEQYDFFHYLEASRLPVTVSYSR